MTAGALLFGRSYSLSIGVPPPDATTSAKIQSMVLNGTWNDRAQGIAFNGFDIEFEVTKTTKAEPNKGKLTIYGLSQKTRQSLSGKTPLVVKLDVGYNSQNETIYQGTMRSAWSNRTGSQEQDVVTYCESGDSELNFAQAKIAYNQGPKSPRVAIGDALRALIASLGVGEGNIASILPAFKQAGLSQVNSAGLHGNSAARLTDLCRSIGFSWFVQNGSVQVLPIGGVLNPTLAITLGNDSGLIGSPTVDSQGIISGKCLITPGLAPGTLIVVNGEFVQGPFKVIQTRHVGATKGQEWYIEFQGRRFT